MTREFASPFSVGNSLATATIFPIFFDARFLPATGMRLASRIGEMLDVPEFVAEIKQY